MRKYLLIALAASLFASAGCSTVKSLASKGVDVVATVGKAPLSLLDVSNPLVPDPAQPGDTNAVVVNPTITAAAQGAATTFGGPYGAPIAGLIGLIAGAVGMYFTAQNRKRASK